MRLFFLPAALCVVSLSSSPAAQEIQDSLERNYAPELTRIPPTSPDEALNTFRIHPDFRIELVAAEPLVRDPIAMAFDEHGRMYVVEMRGYSEGRDEHIGAVRLLVDTDSDGVFDSSTLFAGGLAWPTAVACYDGGVFVGVAPDILYLKDTDGDGHADLKEVVYTGFGLSNVQGLLNTFKWGLDNRIHGATSGSGGSVRRADSADAPTTSLSGRDFSFDPRSRVLTATSGGAQHGLTFDEYGRKLVCHNSDHIQLLMYEDRYVARNPFLPAPTPRISIASDGPQADVFRMSPVEPWRIVRTRLRVKGIVPGPIEGGGKASGYFTSATGITVYKGDAWPAEYKGNVFIGDVGGNLVHRKTLSRNGIELRADRADSGKEFLASTDVWFRPVQFCNGPDGNLYIADMYREIIEHPDSLPPIIKQHLDLTSGSDRGRIYRIVSKDFAQGTIETLANRDSQELAGYLAHPNAWHRETAARLLYEKHDAGAAEIVAARLPEIESPVAKIQTLYTLSGLGEIPESVLMEALTDGHPQVRRHALRLCETLMSPSKAMRDRLRALSSDPDPEVRYQLAFTLGMWSNPEKLDTLVHLAKAEGDDLWFRTALLSSLGTDGVAVARELLGDLEYISQKESLPFLRALAEEIGARAEKADLESFLETVERIPEETGRVAQELVTGLLEGARRAGSGHRVQPALQRSAKAQEASRTLIRKAQASLSNSSSSIRARMNALGNLVFAPYRVAEPYLVSILVDDSPVALRLAALKAISSYDDPAVAHALIGNWPHFSSKMYVPVMDALLARKDRIEVLLGAVESGEFSIEHLASTHRHLLRTHREESVRALAGRVLSEDAPQEMQDVLRYFEGSATLDGLPSRGRGIYEERCATCHIVRGIGESVGPDLKSVRDWDAPRIILSILDPNAEINPQFRAFSIDTRDGRFLTGIMESETATSVTLKKSGGLRDTVLRSQVVHMEESALSLMPDGLGEGLNVADMADLVAFLKEEE